MDADFVKILEGVCDTPKRILTKSEKVPKAFAFGNSSIIYNIENASFFAGVRKTAFLIYDPFLFRVLRRFHVPTLVVAAADQQNDNQDHDPATVVVEQIIKATTHKSYPPCRLFVVSYDGGGKSVTERKSDGRKNLFY